MKKFSFKRASVPSDQNRNALRGGSYSLVVPAILPAVFSCYFDIFDGLIQAYVFVFLTALFIKEAID